MPKKAQFTHELVNKLLFRVRMNFPIEHVLYLVIYHFPGYMYIPGNEHENVFFIG
jgi:hypothetical protein